MKTTGRSGSALVAAAAVLGLASGASAVTMSAPTLTNNTTFTLTGGAASDRAAVSGTQNISSTATAFSTRYWTSDAADRGVAASGGTAVAQTNANYTITFTVTHTNGINYQIDIATSLLGALTVKDDGAGLSASGSASVGPVAGSKTGGGALTGSLALAGTTSAGGTSNTSGVDTAISRTSTATIFAVGTGAAQTYTLTFSFTAAANAVQNLTGSDEEGVRLGRATATATLLSGATTGDYAGSPARNGLNDGHFVNVTVTPEPGTLLLVGSGLLGLVFAGKRKRS
jgi:hypothetical protein